MSILRISKGTIQRKMRHYSTVLLSLFIATTGFTADFHVSVSGDHTNPGSETAPFATLERARDAVRELKGAEGIPEGGMNIWVHGGRYPRKETFLLGKEDGGEQDRPVSYKAVEGEMVRITGSQEIPSAAFQPIADPTVIERLDPSAVGKILRANLHEIGIEDLGVFPEQFEGAPVIPELFFNDQRMALARWPNEGWAEIETVIESGPAPWRNHESDRLGVFEYAGDRPARWLRAPEVWLQGYWCFDWSCETIKVKTIDVEKRHITLGRPHVYGLGSGNPAKRRYFALNLLEELDHPGEYFLDRGEKALYFWPPGPLEGSQTVLSTLTGPVISLEETSYVRLEGLTVEACAGAGLEMIGGNRNRIRSCQIRNTGMDGIDALGGNECRIESCSIHDTGATGIRIQGGDRRTLTGCGHEVMNNHIWNVSRRQRTHAYHVDLGGVGIRVANNLFHDAPHQSILLSGNDHLIELNEVHRTGMETDDSGAFYMGRNPSERGNVIRHNYWHDIGSPLTHGSCAIYFDDGTGGQLVYGNIFYRAAGGNFGAVFVHGGHDNTVANNLFIECKRAIGHVPWNDKTWKEWLDGPLWKQRLLEEVDITRSPFTDRYSELEDFLNSHTRPRKNTATGNVAFRCDSFINGEWNENDNLITTEDPGFVDLESLNFELKPDSIVFQEIPGFKEIPWRQIGLIGENREY